jgi:hypothetical protein
MSQMTVAYDEKSLQEIAAYLVDKSVEQTLQEIFRGEIAAGVVFVKYLQPLFDKNDNLVEGDFLEEIFLNPEDDVDVEDLPLQRAETTSSIDVFVPVVQVILSDDKQTILSAAVSAD